jgi:hypothetical protein
MYSGIGTGGCALKLHSDREARAYLGRAHTLHRRAHDGARLAASIER